MNHSYRLIWNAREGRCVPAPETAVGRGKAGGCRLSPLAL
ncbi:ESPR domain-containing protein, partial [Azoarcus indigens]